MIRQLTRWVLAAALSQSSGWRTLAPDAGLSINVSSFDLIDERLPEFIAAQLERWHFPAARLTLEITEGTLLTDPDRSLEVLEYLRNWAFGSRSTTSVPGFRRWPPSGCGRWTR